MKKIFYLSTIAILIIFTGCSGNAGISTINSTDSASSGSLSTLLNQNVAMGSVFPNYGSGKRGNQIVIISDTHMGDQRSIDNGYGWLAKNGEKLAEFLNTLTSNTSVKELVIAGDLFDEWVVPMKFDTFNGYGSESKFLDSICEANPDVINGIKNVIESGIKVTYVPGNHDMLVNQEDIERIFPGMYQARDASGCGSYSPDGRQEIVIEHGHRYDFYNAPDMYSNRVPYSPVDYTDNPDAIIPPGFFVSKIAASQGYKSLIFPGELINTSSLSGPSLYWFSWCVILGGLHVTENLDEKIILTGIDGYTDVYAINDLLPQYSSNNISEPLLYREIENNWKIRQEQNHVNKPITVLEGILTGSISVWCSSQAITQYFNIDPQKRVVVFGHTHNAVIYTCENSQSNKCLYANSGTWVDNGNPTCTFALINPEEQEDGSTREYIGVYRYVDPGNLVKMYEETITIN